MGSVLDAVIIVSFAVAGVVLFITARAYFDAVHERNNLLTRIEDLGCVIINRDKRMEMAKQRIVELKRDNLQMSNGFKQAVDAMMECNRSNE